MASVLDVNASLSVELRFTALEMAGQGSFCEDKVQPGQDLQVDGQLCGVRRKLIAQISQNSFDLLLLLNFQGAQFVV